MHVMADSLYKTLQEHMTYVVSGPCADCYECATKPYSAYYNPVGVHKVT
jgi:hypothetical protein